MSKLVDKVNNFITYELIDEGSFTYTTALYVEEDSNTHVVVEFTEVFGKVCTRHVKIKQFDGFLYVYVKEKQTYEMISYKTSKYFWIALFSQSAY